MNANAFKAVTSTMVSVKPDGIAAVLDLGVPPADMELELRERPEIE